MVQAVRQVSSARFVAETAGFPSVNNFTRRKIGDKAILDQTFHKSRDYRGVVD